ncbi:glutathione S-transferase [Roridomyces roridus]|uniref:glutathione transferase n=1 Tax=Roridomyces roridus TaxID=1738132 RepID=A0AAD7FV65_9AGAR|nr:glutathione S-transferase [Roridomyces roridus]
MVLKLHGGNRPGGGNGIVAVLLAEKQIPFELVRVDMAAKEHKTPEHLAKQPFGQVPYIDDDGFIVYESRAICRYLAEKYADQGPTLIPTDLKQKAMFEQAASVESANWHPAVMKVLMEKMGKTMRGETVDEVALAGYVEELREKLKVYDVILGKQKYVAGDEFTLADIFHLMYMPMVVSNGIDVVTTSGPNVARWWNELVTRPSWVKLQAEGVQSTPQ